MITRLTIAVALFAAALACALGLSVRARAHDRLADGREVPAWIKNACCGPNDFHPLTAEQVHAKPDGWHVEGFKETIPYGTEQPSPDNSYVIFYIDLPDGTQSHPFCFFVPPSSF